MPDLDGCAFCEVPGRNTWILTHLAPPATVNSCEAHVVPNLISLLAIQIDVPPDWLYDTIETATNEMVAKAKAEVEAAEEPAPAKPSGASAKPKHTEAVEDAAV